MFGINSHQRLESFVEQRGQKYKEGEYREKLFQKQETITLS
jgi:hypothetical protein